MINNNNIENNLQNWMQPTPDVEIHMAWDDMKDKLQEKKKRRFFWWWFPLVAIGIVAGIALWYNSSSKKINNIVASKHTEQVVANTGKDLIKEEQKNKEVSVEQRKNNVTKNDNLLAKDNEIIESNTSKKEIENNTSITKKVDANKEINSSKKSNETIVNANKNDLSAAAKSINNNYLNPIINKEINIEKAFNKKTSKQSLTPNSVAKNKAPKTIKEKPSVVKKVSSNKEKVNKNTKETIDKIDKKEISNNRKEIETNSNETTTSKVESKKIDSTKNDSSKIKAIAKTQEITKKPEPKKEEKQNNNKLSWGYGLEWQYPIPFTKSEYFLSGKNLKPNVFNYFIPSIYTNVTLNNKHTLLAGFTPFSQYNIPSVQYDVLQGAWIDVAPQLRNIISTKDTSWVLRDTNGIPLQDTSGNYILDTKIQVYKRSNANKAFGYGIYLDYYYNISPKIQIGVGGVYNAITSYINTSTVNRGNISNPSPQQTESLINDTALLTPSQSNGKINNYFLSGKVSVLYNLKRVAFGISTTIPFSGVNKEGEVNKAPIFNVLFRLKIK